MRLFRNQRGQAIPPAVIIVAAAFAGLYYVGEAVVKEVKKVDRVVAHEAKKVGRGIVHVVTFGKK